MPRREDRLKKQYVVRCDLTTSQDGQNMRQVSEVINSLECLGKLSRFYSIRHYGLQKVVKQESDVNKSVFWKTYLEGSVVNGCDVKCLETNAM